MTRLVTASLIVAFAAGCSGAGPKSTASAVTASTASPVATPTASPAPTPPRRASPTPQANVFPTEAFADTSAARVSEALAGELQAILTDMAGESDAGMTATVMTANGTWSGAVGKADDVRDVQVDDQFAIGSVTKTVVAAQVMQMVEAGELSLDDPAAGYLPADLDFDTNGATIRQLLSMRSGLPDYVGALWDSLSTDRQRFWLPADMLELVAAERVRPGGGFEYSSTNYLLLGLVIEQIRGRPLGEVLRDGVLSVIGTERLIYQPDEAPTEPMAMPEGESTAVLEEGGGFLPSLAGATAAGPAGAMASDSPSLARWWRAFCAGEIVSQASLTEMAPMGDGYRLGLYRPAPGTVGHSGDHVGYTSMAGCLPEHGAVVVVLTNQAMDIGPLVGRLIGAVRAG